MTTPPDSVPPPAKRPRKSAAERQKARRSLREDALNVPNLLTFGRILVIPLVLLLLDRGTPEDCVLAALVYSAAAITDLIDGWLARKLNVVSMLGKFLDPLADKLLVMAVLVYMVPMGRMPEWAVVLLLAREISVTGLRGIASSEGVVIAAGDDGKTKTALQMVGILCLLLGYPYHLSLGPIDLGVVDLVVVGRLLVYVSLFFSLASAFSYTRLFAEAVDAKNQRQKSG
jgi:CDP-diacylglycerol--glycerol-3-phosphate 3-phosphatidyltransferase